MSSLENSTPPLSLEETRADLLAQVEREQSSREERRAHADYLRNNFGAFIREAWDTVEPAMPLIDNWHIDALALHLQAVAEGRIRNLLINIGPGYAKSIIAAVMFSAWLWTRNPQTRIMAASYALTLTIRDSVRTRDLINSPWFQDTFAPEWKLVKENEDFFNNDTSGSRLALSVGGKATGFRADGQIMDDLLNASDTHSEAARESAKVWALSTMSTRYNDMRIGWRVVIGQRLHEQDPYGEMLATGDYVHLCLPSEYEVSRHCVTSIGWQDPRTEEGELLFPEFFTPAVIAQAKKDLRSYGYAGQHQQRPAPAEGGLFKRDHWQYYDVLPALDSKCISVDAAFKDSKDSDFVAIHVWGFLGPRCYLIDRLNQRMGFTATKEAIRGFIALYADAWTRLIEDKANGTAIIEELKREFSGVIAINPDGGKEARAWAVQPDHEAGNIYLPRTGWAQEVVEQCAAFPNSAYDDDVDTMTQAINHHKKNYRRLGLLTFYEQEQERLQMQMGNVLRKPFIEPPVQEQCSQCQATTVSKLYQNYRCQQCGHQWPIGSQKALPTEPPTPPRYDMMKVKGTP